MAHPFLDAAALSYVGTLVCALLVFDLIEKHRGLRDDGLGGLFWPAFRLAVTAFFLVAAQVLGAEQSQQFIYFQF